MEVWLILHANHILRVRTGALGNFWGHFFIALGRYTLCEFSKTKFVRIGHCSRPIGSFPKLPKIGKF